MRADFIKVTDLGFQNISNEINFLTIGYAILGHIYREKSKFEA